MGPSSSLNTPNGNNRASNNEFLHGAYRQSFHREDYPERDSYGRPLLHEASGDLFYQGNDPDTFSTFNTNEIDDMFFHAENDEFYYPHS